MRDDELRVEVAGLASRLDAMQASLDRNVEATDGLREDVTRLRTEMNGHLPRIDRNVERIFERLDHDRERLHAYHERSQVQAHEIDTLFEIAGAKADKAGNDDAHSRLWLVMRVSLLAIMTGLAGVLIARVISG